VSGLSKNKIKWIRSLHQKKYRDELGLFLVEGEKMVQEALEQANDNIQFLFHTSEFDFQNSSIESYEISSKELEQISTLKTPNKALAVLNQINRVEGLTSDELIIALDGIQDPGNMGTIMRIADWFGVKQIYCSENTVDFYNPKVVQASMGAIFRIKIDYVDMKSWLTEINLPVYGALLEGENIYEKTELKNGVLLMGNEGKGISKELLPLISHPISIPKFGNAESLNVSVATGILVSEFYRRKT